MKGHSALQPLGTRLPIAKNLHEVALAHVEQNWLNTNHKEEPLLPQQLLWGCKPHVQSLRKYLWLHTSLHRSQLGIIKLTELSWPLIPCLGPLHFVNYPLLLLT